MSLELGRLSDHWKTLRKHGDPWNLVQGATRMSNGFHELLLKDLGGIRT